MIERGRKLLGCQRLADVGTGVELVKLDGVLMSFGGGEITFGEDGEVGVVTLVGEEGGDTSGFGGSVVVGELGEGKEIVPVVLLVVAVGSEILFQD